MHIVDALVHPKSSGRDELREYMDEPFRHRPFPPAERYFYPNPLGEATSAPASSLLATDPARTRDELSLGGSDAGGPRHAILLPLTHGLLPDVDLGNAVCAATNEWLAAKWLAGPAEKSCFYGSIRVNPLDPVGAVQEIEKWAQHPLMVQVGVPMESLHPYGQRMFHDIWRAADRHGLPVAIHSDGGSGVDFAPTLTGYVHHFVEREALYPINYAFHLASFIAEGVFERLPGLRIIFADGGLDMLKPLIWRLNKDWRSTKSDTPWVSRQPEDYLREHVRFCTHLCEHPPPGEGSARWAELADYASLLMYGSGYPMWNYFSVGEATEVLPSGLWETISYTNAAALYNLASRS